MPASSSLKFGVLALCLAFGAGRADDGISICLPGSGGADYARLSAEWWRWALANWEVVTDPTGEHCALNQPRPDVWFLAGTPLAGTPMLEGVVRACRVPAGRRLFFPLLNGWQGCPYPGETVDDLRAQLAPRFEHTPTATPPVAVSLGVSIDGVRLQQLLKQVGGEPSGLSVLRTQSDVFELDLAGMAQSTEKVRTVGQADSHDDDLAHDDLSDKAWFVGEYRCPLTAVGDGYYVLVDPLAPGDHIVTINSSRTTDGKKETVGVTYHLVVTPSDITADGEAASPGG